CSQRRRWADERRLAWGDVCGAPGAVGSIVGMDRPAGRLLAISDLHVTYPENRHYVSELRPQSPDDWLIVAGDVAERVADVAWALGRLRERFAEVVWAP